MFELDRDTELREEAPGRFALELSDAWGIYRYPNGGFLAALGARALGRALPHPDPLTLTAHYLRPAEPGPATVEVEVVREGRTASTGEARIIQGDKERVRLLASFGDLSKHEGPTEETGSPRPVPPLEACEPLTGPPPGSTFAERIEARYAPGTASFLRGERGAPEIGGWIRARDGRPADLWSLILFADAWPPPVLNLVSRVWVPTIELTVHLRRRPAPGWIAGWFETGHLIDGYLGTDGELWDERGRLVARCRQLARLQSS